MSELLSFTRYPTTTGIALAYLLDDLPEYRGIYVLKFWDGTEYVGQAVDVLTRFRAHARRYGDEIMSIDFAPVMRSSLDGLERLTIQWRQKQGAALRNVLLTGPEIPNDPPDHWLANTYPASFQVLPAERFPPPLSAMRPALSQNPMKSFGRLIEHPRGESVIDALAAFLVCCVPLPVATEQQGWVVTAMPRSDDGLQRLACLTIQNLQFLSFYDDARGGTYAKTVFSPQTKLAIANECVESSNEPGHSCMQRDHIQPEILMETLTVGADFCTNIREAASAWINRGPSLIGSLHCRPLADAIYARIVRSKLS